VQLCLILFVEVQKLYENEATEENQYEPSVYDPMTFFVGMAVLILFVEVQKLYEASEENQYEPSVYDPMTFFCQCGQR
jgi:hypothetical protein